MLAVADGPSVENAEVASAAHEPVAITVPDAHLLFNGEFQRVGTAGLKIVGEDGASFFIPDYFDAELRAALMSPEGATLSRSVVEALAGPLAAGQYAQAGAQPVATQPVIGRVDALAGSATVVRNGVTVALNVGDTVRRGDVVQTSGGSSVAIVFSDGTTFSLSANARMVLNDFVYSQASTDNSALINLVQGSFSFVAGQLAKTGELRVETPVATLGIRGTAVLVEISAADGRTRFSVMVEPDGSTGAFNIYNKTTGALIATVNNSQIAWVVSPVGPLQVIAQQEQKTPAQLQQELGIVQQIFTIFNNNQQNPFVPQQDSPERRGDNPNDVQTAQGGGSSGEPLSVSIQVPDPSAIGGFVTATVTVSQIDAAPGTTNPASVTVPPVTAPSSDGAVPQPTGGGPSNPFDFSKAKTGLVITGSDADDLIIGSSFDDTIDAGAGNDIVFGGPGNDAIIAGHGEGDDTYDGGAGVDTISFLSANGVVFHLNETALANGDKLSRAQSFFTGNDIFTNIERIVASPGNDIFYIHLDGNWSIDALAGFDTLSFASRNEGLVTTLGIGGSTLQGTATSSQLGTILFSGIESVVGSTGNDSFVLSDPASWVALGDGQIWEIRGNAGVDELRVVGSGGLTYSLNSDVSFGPTVSTIDIASSQFRFSEIETIVAGAGHDTFVFRDLTTPIVDAGAGIDTVRLADGLDILNWAGGPKITNFEILDLAADSNSNTVRFDVADFDRIGSLPLRVRGGENDILNLTDVAGLDADIVRIESNVLSETVFGDGLTDGVRFDVYRVSVGSIQHLIYVQQGVQVATPVGANDDQGSMGEKQNATFDVLANDSGGLLAKLMAVELVSVAAPSGVVLGVPSISIVDNKISIVPGSAFNGLAQGQVATLTITYTMQNGVGETSSATATITVIGANDAPVVAGPVTGQAIEDGPAVTLNGLANASDPDGNTLGLIVVLNDLPAGVTYNSAIQSFTLDPGHPAYQSLAAGQQSIVEFNYQVFDGAISVPAAVSWTVTGINDAPVVSGAVTGAATEGGPPVQLNALANASDVDANTTLSVVNIPTTLPAGVIFNAVNQTFTLDPSHGNYQLLAEGEQLTVTVNYGVSDGIATTPTSVSWTVTGTGADPVANDDTQDMPENAVALIDVLANDAVGIVSKSLLSIGTATITGPQGVPLGQPAIVIENDQIRITPGTAFDALAQGQTATIVIPYTMQANGTQLTAIATVTVVGTNDAPVLVTADTTGSVSTGSPLSSVAAGYLTAGSSLINGLGGSAGFGEGFLDRNDDGSTSGIDITAIFGEQGLNFFGNYYTAIYINNNGNITFSGPLSTFTPSEIAGGDNNPIIAPFWADVDTRPEASLSPTPGGNSSGSNLVYYDLDAANGVLTVTWDDVGYYDRQTNKLNAFQLQLIDRGNGDFDILFRYEDINWTTGDASGGSNGLDGTPARAGYTAGDGNPAFELAGSGTQNAMLALESAVGNTGIAGVHVFEVRSGAVGTPTTAGTIQFSDVDVNDSHTVTVAYNGVMSSGATALGVLNTTLAQQTGVVTWQYVIDPTVLNGLESGTVVIEVFDVTIDDGKGGAVTQPVTITVNGPQAGTTDGPLMSFSSFSFEGDNTPPFAGDINLLDVVYEDAPFNFDPAAFLVNATDLNGDIILLATVADSYYGATVTLGPDGRVTYDPTTSAILQALDAGETIEDTFEFTLRDHHGDISNSANARVTVYGVNDFSI